MDQKYFFEADAFFQNLIVKNRKTDVIITAMIINPGLLGAMSGASDVQILCVSFNDERVIIVNRMASILHLFIINYFSFFLITILSVLPSSCRSTKTLLESSQLT